MTLLEGPPPAGDALWNRQDFRAVAGDALRPGGLALTAAGVALCRESGLGFPCRVLDMGCGAGATLEWFEKQGCTAWGLDVAPKCDGNAHGTIRADAAAMPLKDALFDLVVCECVLSLFSDVGTVLEGAVRVLEAGGMLLCSDMYLRGPSSPCRADGVSCVAGARSRDEWEALFAGAGLRTLHFRDHSRELALLAARLVWYGISPCGETPCDASGGRRPVGYGLWVARRS
ncbi:MAG: class I SAM-dependent methyltransferase [Desulfovibrio sp.]|nr:class I SAM-dependent methyltransferase [Desulfovibrio sp.]